VSTGLLEVHAREKVGASETWTLFKYECLPPGETTEVYRLTGALESAHKNGRPKWLKPHREIYITPREHDAWCAEWERRNGLCRDCLGEKVVCVGFSVTEGRRTRTCGRCGGSGVPSQPPARSEASS
jgi:hypothetical protein